MILNSAKIPISLKHTTELQSISEKLTFYRKSQRQVS